MAEDTKSTEVKFTDDEMKSLQDLQTGYQEKTTALGQLSVQRILLNQQIESLEQSMETVEKEYKTLKNHAISFANSNEEGVMNSFINEALANTSVSRHECAALVAISRAIINTDNFITRE